MSCKLGVDHLQEKKDSTNKAKAQYDESNRSKLAVIATGITTFIAIIGLVLSMSSSFYKKKSFNEELNIAKNKIENLELQLTKLQSAKIDYNNMKSFSDSITASIDALAADIKNNNKSDDKLIEILTLLSTSFDSKSEDNNFN